MKTERVSLSRSLALSLVQPKQILSNFNSQFNTQFIFIRQICFEGHTDLKRDDRHFTGSFYASNVYS